MSGSVARRASHRGVGGSRRSLRLHGKGWLEKSQVFAGQGLMPDVKFIGDDRLIEFMRRVPGDRRFTNSQNDEGRLWVDLEDADPAAVLNGLRGARPYYSLKSALMPAIELVARYGQAQDDPLAEVGDAHVVLIGVRGCECRALSYLDAIMLDEPMPEPFYESRRKNCTIVSVDCAVPAESCFCNLLGEPAYAEANFDLNLSPCEGGFLVEAGSETGEAILADASSLLSDATGEQQDARDDMQRQAAETLDGQNAQYGLPEDFAESMPATLEEAFWRAELAECVQCGGCTAVCPTCYCFLLYDQEAGEGAYERVRVWDSCQFTGYSEMAGPPGTMKPDPRRGHMSKFQHRFAHKFWYSGVYPGILGCVGCGRCRDTCPGAIDLRRVLSEMQSERVKNE